MPPLRRRRLPKLKKPRPGQPSREEPGLEKLECAAAGPPADEKPAAERLLDAAAEKEEEEEEGKEEGKNQLKYTFPSPSPSPWARKRKEAREGRRETAAAAAAAPHTPQGAEAPFCTKCGGAAYSMQCAIGLSALLDGSKMLLSMACVVLGVVVMVLMSATWVLTRASTLLEGLHIGREEEKEEGEEEEGEEEQEKEEEVLIDVENEGAGMLLRRDSRGELYELDNYGANQPEEGYEFVPEIRPVIVFREERLAFAAARKAWVGGRIRAASCDR